MSETKNNMPIPVRTIATPLLKVSERLIQRRKIRNDSNSFENAVQSGDAGLIGVDGSGNDWEFSQTLGSAALQDVQTEEYVEEDLQ